NEYKVNETLSTLLEKYEDCGFIKTHKSYLVNYLYIYEFRRNCVVLDNQVELPLSKNRTSEIKQQYTSFTRRELQ
ncbi:MAG: LytTR family transcriptional regulator, partial [Oscillospiraceae bacterium]|nr:LytTR family transcriptional regulator [Oscillospiraceae bacterium]